MSRKVVEDLQEAGGAAGGPHASAQPAGRGPQGPGRCTAARRASTAVGHSVDRTRLEFRYGVLTRDTSRCC